MKTKSTRSVFYYKNGMLITEINPSFDVLKFLYTNLAGKIIRRLITRRWLARLIGIYKDSRFSKHLIQPFIKAYNIDMSEYRVPVEGYISFNDFFIRAFKSGIRPIPLDQQSVVSPADAKLYAIQNLTANSIFFVKQKPFNLEKFLGNKELTDYYCNGTLIIFRLAPYDYHRFHFPVDCTPSEPRRIPGILESVNPITFKNGIQPLTTNERQLILLKTDLFQTVAMIPVGATMVGKIVQTFTPNQTYKKGDEAGYFAFGGSTVVLLFKQGTIQLHESFLQHSLQGYETAVKMGETINRSILST